MVVRVSGLIAAARGGLHLAVRVNGLTAAANETVAIGVPTGEAVGLCLP